MKLSKKVWIGIVAVALTGVLTGILAPRAAYSIVSTLVTVVNPPTQPVRTLATDANSAFTAHSFCPFIVDVCEIPSLYTVPAGKTAVIESASGVCVLRPGSTVREFQLQFKGPGGVDAQLSVPPTPGIESPVLGAAVSTTGQNLKSYAAGGASSTPIRFRAFSSHDQFALGFFCGFTLSGHLVSTP